MLKIDGRELKDKLLLHYFESASGLDLVDRFSAIQIDPIALVAQNQLLVLSARCGVSARKTLDKAYAARQIVELYAKERCLILRKDAPLFGPMQKRRRDRRRDILREHKPQIKSILQHIKEHGAISARDILAEPVKTVSSWGPKRQGTLLLSLLWEIGDIVVHSRAGRNIFYAAADETIWTHKEKTLSDDDLRFLRWARYLEGAGIIDSRDTFAGFERAGVADRRRLMNELVESGLASPVKTPQTSLSCIVSTQLLSLSTKKAATALPCFVPPLDNFIWNRNIVRDIWGLDYKWEIYTPPHQRKFGPYAMPLVTQEGVFGPVDFRVDRDSNALIGKLSNSPLAKAPKKLHAAAQTALARLAESAGASSATFV